VVVGRAEQVRDDLEAALGTEVDRPGEIAVVARELRLVAQEPADVAVDPGGDGGDRVAVLLDEGRDVVAEAGAQPRLDLRSGQRVR
jgi:hypothetical protein